MPASFLRLCGRSELVLPGDSARHRESSPPRNTQNFPKSRVGKVRRLIRAVNGKTRPELRARAILLLCSICGLRSSEIAHLCLDDFDWRNKTFRVHRAKRGGIQQYPYSI